MENKETSNVWQLSNTCYVDFNVGAVYCLENDVVRQYSFGTKQTKALVLLKLFIRKQGRFLSREIIFEEVWQNERLNREISCVNQQVRKLRQMGELETFIQTRGRGDSDGGYTFVCPELKEIPAIPAVSGENRIPYYKALWTNHFKGIVRDQAGSGKVREMIDFYVLPEITAVNGRKLEAPFSDLSRYMYVTAGSGFGKSALLHIILLSCIIDTLIAEHSDVISQNSLSKVSEYREIRHALFGDAQPYFPVFIYSAKANNTAYGSVLDLAEARTTDRFQNLIDDASKAGTLLFLIDSLDEVESGEKMDSFINGVHKLLSEEYPNAKAIITSRFLGRMPLPFECRTAHISELGDEAIQQITKLVLYHRSEKELLNVLTGLTTNPHLASLAKNPFTLLTMLEEKNTGHLHQVLESIVHAVIERRWDAVNKVISAEKIKMLLGHLACSFVFGDVPYVSRSDIEKSFYKAEESLRNYQMEIGIPRDDMERFLRVMSCQSGILSIQYQNHIEKFMFQDSLVMCWLAAYYISRILFNAEDVGIEDRNTEAGLWSNALWLDNFIRSFASKRSTLSANAVNTLIILLIICSEDSGDVFQLSILYYLLFKDAVSLSAAEKANIATGYRAIIDNTFGENDIANHPESIGRRLICSATNNHKII